MVSPNTPDNSGLNTANTAQNGWRNFLETSFNRALLATSRLHLASYRDSQAFARTLSNPEKALEFVRRQLEEHITDSNANIPWESTISEEGLVRIATDFRKKTIRSAAVIASKRSSILKSIESEFFLTDHEKQVLDTDLYTRSVREYPRLEGASGRKLYMREVFGDALPPTVELHKRVRNALGESLNTLPLESFSYKLIGRFIDTGEISPGSFAILWEHADDQARRNLLNILTPDFDLQELHQLAPNIFSEELLIAMAREEIADHFSDDIDDETREIILNELSWKQIAKYRIPAHTALKIFEHERFGYPVPSLPYPLVAALIDWYGERVQEEKSESESENPISEELPAIDSELLDTLHSRLQLKQATLSGDDLLLSEAFRAGNQKLIVQVNHANGESIAVQIRAIRSEDQNNPNIYSLSAAPLDEDLKPLHLNRTIIPGSLLQYMFDPLSHSTIQTEADFYQEHGESIPEEAFPESRINRNEVDPNTIPPAEEDTTEDGEDDDLFGPRWSTLHGALLATELREEGHEEDAEEDTERPENGEDTWDGDPANEGHAPLTTDETSEAASESPLPETEAEFNTALSKLLGKEVKIAVGMSISIGKPGADNFNVFRIQRIGEHDLTLWDGAGSAETLPFSILFDKGFKKDSLYMKLIESHLSSAEDFLTFMQETSPAKDDWMNLGIEKQADWSEYFDFLDRKFDAEKIPKKYFVGRDGRILEIISIHGDTVKIRTGKNFKDGKWSEESTAEWMVEQEFPFQYLSHFMLRYSLRPWNRPEREIRSRAVEAETEKGKVKAWFGRLSIHDIVSGSKKFFEELKHHLEHGNHLQEQRVMLGIAKRIGMDKWNSEWYADYKSKYENEEKSLIEKRLETLGKMSTPLRQRSIRASLLNDGTHDYDHWTNALCMIEKHGTLYAGELQDLEGTWIFFKRVAGIPLDADVSKYKEFQKAVASIKKKWVDNITEEAVLEEHMKIDWHFPNSQIWRMVKKRVKEGTNAELESGKNETSEFNDLDTRLTYVLGKLKGKEYAHAIGGLEALFEKDGPAWKKQNIAFALAMSRIPERLTRPLLDRFTGIYDAGRLHSPALMFIKNRSSQDKFRKTVEAIAQIKIAKLKRNPATKSAGDLMQKRFDTMMWEIGRFQDTKDSSWTLSTASFDAIQEFWNAYGADFQAELTFNQTANITTAHSLRKEHPILEEYRKTVYKELGDADILKNWTEVDRWTPFMDGDSGAGVVGIRPEKIIDKLGIQINRWGFSQDGLEKALQADFRVAMEHVRDKNPEVFSEDDKREWFRTIYTGFINKIIATGDLRAFLEHETVKPFRKLGLEPPVAATEDEIKAEVTGPMEEVARIKDSILKDVAEQKALEKEATKQTIDQQWRNRLMELNIKLHPEKARISELEAKIKKIQAKKWLYCAYDPNNGRHRDHFEEQFRKFLNSGNPAPSAVVTTQNTTAARAAQVQSQQIAPPAA